MIHGYTDMIYHDTITATMFTFVVCYTFQSFHWSQEARNLLLWNPGPADSPDTPLDFLQLSGQAEREGVEAIRISPVNVLDR